MSSAKEEDAQQQHQWNDAILDLVNNGYSETPSPNTNDNFKDSVVPNFTFDLGLLGDTMTAFYRQEEAKKDQQQQSKDNKPLFTPHVSVETPVTSRGDKGISYLEVMLQQNEINFPFLASQVPSPSPPALETSEEINNIGTDVVPPNSDLDISLTAMLQQKNIGHFTFPTFSVSNNFPTNDEVEDEDDQEPTDVIDSAEVTILTEEQYNAPDVNNPLSDIIDDDSLVSISVPELNKILKNLPQETSLQVKQRRRLLKNRGYARNCRSRRIHSEQYYCEENRQLKQLLEAMTTERNMYKTKYEGLKTVIKKAKIDREQRKNVQQ